MCNISLHQFLELGFAKEILYYVESFLNGQKIFQWKHQPTAHHARTHRRNGFIHNVEKAFTILIHRRYQLKATCCESVNTNIPIFLYAVYRYYVINLSVMRHIHIVQNSSRGNDAQGKMSHTKTLQVFCLEVFEKSIVGGLFSEHPIVKLKEEVMISEFFFKFLFFSTFYQNLFWRETRKQFVDVICHPFTGKKLTSRNIKQ